MKILKKIFLILCLVILSGCISSSEDTTEISTDENSIVEVDVKTTVKQGGITITITAIDESNIKSIKIVDKNSTHTYLVENNTITIPADFNVQYNFDVVIVDNNNTEKVIKNLVIQPGSIISPYEISEVEDLINISNNLAAIYNLTDNIDLSNVEWVPIAPNTPFTGILDGNGFVIENLTMSGDYEVGGLFGVNAGEIKNIKLSDINIDISGSAGGISNSNEGEIIYSSVTGVIKAQTAGGLVAFNKDSINSSFSAAIVSGTIVGGIAGENYDYIRDSFAWGNVSATYNESLYSHAGGLVGYNKGKGVILRSYAIGNLTSQLDNVIQGGIVGTNIGIISNSFAVGNVEAGLYTGGLVGKNCDILEEKRYDGQIYNSFKFSGQIVKTNKYKNSLGGDFGLSELKSSSWYSNTLEWGYIWNFSGLSEEYYPVHINNTPSIHMPSDYHYGSIGNPIEISTKQELINIKDNLYSAYKLVNDIDLKNEDWIPIGTNDLPFTGNFDGNGYVISNLTISVDSNDTTPYWGLFGSNFTTIKNTRLENILVNVDNSSLITVGGLVGNNVGIINNSYVTGDISLLNSNSKSGGLVGESSGNIFNTYADVDITVSTDSDVVLGGLVGYNNGKIETSYALGNITGNGAINSVYVGGLVGKFVNGDINNSLAIGDVKSNGFTGRIVGGDESTDHNITKLYYYENQMIMDIDENDKTPVDEDNENIVLATASNLNDMNWYLNILGFDETVWDFTNLSDGNFPKLK